MKNKCRENPGNKSFQESFYNPLLRFFFSKAEALELQNLLPCNLPYCRFMYQRGIQIERIELWRCEDLSVPGYYRIAFAVACAFRITFDHGMVGLE